MAATPYAPAIVIGNLAAFFAHIGVEVVARERAGAAAPALPDADTIVSEMAQNHYVRVDGRRRPADAAAAPHARGRRDGVIALVLGPGKYSQNGPELRKLIAGVESERMAQEGRLDEVFIFADKSFFLKKNLTDVLQEFITLASRDADREGRAPFFSAYPYSLLVMVIPDHKSVPHHRIMVDDEVKKLLAEQRKTLDDLPVIPATDPPVVWCGGRVGQVVEISRASETAGELTPYYRRIVRAKLFL
jgi:DNA-directed RNA polymerase subunit H